MGMIENKLAKREYSITDTWVAGVGRGSLRDAYAKLINNELFLINADIPQYSHFAGEVYDPKRSRKLLLNSKEIFKIYQQIEGKNLTLIPLRLFFKGRWVKCEIGLGKGKREWEKREDIKKREVKREMAKAMRHKI